MQLQHAPGLIPLVNRNAQVTGRGNLQILIWPVQIMIARVEQQAPVAVGRPDGAPVPGLIGRAA